MKNNFPSVVCPMCGEGTFESFDDGVFSFRHGNKSYSVPEQNYAKCSACETSGYLPGQRKKNSELISDFQKLIPDYVSPSDVLAVRERYSLTQKQAAQIFKGGPNGFSKWERGVTFPSGPTAMLIKVALSSSDAMRALAKVACVSFPIVDNFEALIPPVALEVVSKSELLIIQCTHSEYNDDVDIDDESEKIEKWISNKTQVQEQASNFLN